MKKFFLYFILSISIPFNGITQSERDQKTSIRNTPQTKSSNFQNQSEIYEKSSIRQQNYQSPNPRYPQPVIYNDPWMWNRWNRWGTPVYGYNYFDTWYMNDYYGRRIPTRVYYYSDRKTDTIYGKPLNTRLGINFSTQKDIGGWITIGSKNFFFFEVNTKIVNDNSTYYNDSRVNFISASQIWKDERKEDIKKGSSVYIGFGAKFKNTQPYLALGFSKEKNLYQFYDETFILSNNGLYSFNSNTRNITSFKMGLIQDWKRFSLKADYDPFRNNFGFGVGLNF